MERSQENPGVLTLNERLILGSLIAFGIALTIQVTAVPVADVSVGASVPTVEASETGGDLIAIAETDGEGVNRDSVEEYVRTYFADIPVLIEVARCESHFRQIDSTTGSTLRGVVNSSDVGVMQINTYYHGAAAERMGLDLHTLEDNLAYARSLYERQGTQPWSASRACWNSGHLAMR